MIRHAFARAGIRAAAAAVLATLVAGIPAMLIYGVGPPLPSTGLPWTDQLSALLTQPPTGRLLLGIAAILLWALWAVFILSLAAEVAESIRYGLRRTRQRTNPLRAAALLLLTAAATGTLATGATAIHTPAGGSLHDDLGRLTIAAEENLSPPADQPAPSEVTEPVIPPMPATPRSGLWDGTTTRPPAVSDRGGPVVLQAAHQRYTVGVVKGDTLWDLADAWLGDPFRWPEIYELNRDRYDQRGRMQGGHHIEPTWILVLPDDATPPADVRPAPALPEEADHVYEPERVGEPDGSAPADIPHLPDHQLDTAPGPAPPHLPAPSASPDGVWAEPESPLTPGATPAASLPPRTPTPVPETAAAGEIDDDDDRVVPGEHDGITLPGGWVTLALGASLAAAATVGWRRRRHRWTPPPVDMPHPGPAGPPLPEAVARLRRAVHQQAPGMLDPQPPPQATVREAATADNPPPPPPIGPDGAELAGLGTLAAAGTALAGPGAAAAARALLMATLSAGGPHDPDARAEAVIPASVLADLLDGAAVVDLIGTIPRLTVTDGFAHALNFLEEQILTRQRLLADQDVPDLTILHATDPRHPPMPPLLLIADAPAESWSARLSTALQLGEPVAAGAVLLGHWPPGATLHVAADGNTDQPDRRISVLDATTTVDMLTMLREAHTGQTTPAAASEQSPGGADGEADDAAALVALPVADDASSASAPTLSPSDTPVAGPRVKVGILGNAAVYDTNGQPITGLRSAATALLIYLAIHRDGANIPDIQEALTPNATLRRASERLATNVGNFRSQLRRAAGIARDQASDFKPVINTGGRYHLNPACLDIDWWRLLDAAHRAAQATDPATRMAALEEAVSEWNGTIHEDNYDWIEPHQQTCRQYGITIHTQLAKLLADTDPQRAAELLEIACDIDPLNEDVAVLAMRAHAHLGDTAAIRNRHAALTSALEAIDEELAEENLDLVRQLVREADSVSHGDPRRG